MLFCFKDGSQEQKILGIDALIDILSSAKEPMDQEYFKLGKLPRGYYDCQLDLQDTSSFNIALVLPEAVRLLTYFGEDFLIPFPELLFLFSVVERQVKISMCFSVYKEAGKKYIAYYPFGNVYNNGEICWGKNILGCASIQEADKLIELFLGSGTNNDLYEIGHNVIEKEEFVNQRGLILALENKQKFPVQWLIKKGISLDDMVNCFFK